MLNRYFKVILLLIFLTTIVLVVVIQYNSIKNINELVAGNESLLAEFAMKNKLQHLQNDVLTIDNKVRSCVIRNKSGDERLIEDEIGQIRAGVKELGNFLITDSSKRLWEELYFLSEEKIRFSSTVLHTFSISGKQAAEEFINTQRGVRLTEAIERVSRQLEIARQNYLTHITHETDANSQRAKRFGFVLAILCIGIVLVTFGFISNRLRKQQNLIEQLNESERVGKQAAKVKEHFIANMSHEIRTPMNAIIGFTNLLQKRPLDSKSSQFVDSIHKSSEKLLSIINDVLDLSKIEAGMMRIEKSPFQLTELLHSVEDMLYAKAFEKKIKLSYSIDKEIPTALIGDSVRITQVLVNLVSNAIKFTESGFIHVKAKALEVNEKEVLLNLVVEDSGIGIAEEQLPMIFDRFTQAEESTTRRYGGTGLGLSIVQQIVSLHNGSIDVESTVGKGTVFNVKLLLEIAENSQPGEVSAFNKIQSTPVENNMKILVVEDNAMNQMLMEHLLEAWQYQFKIADNGKIALEMLQKEKFNLVLMDIQMPEMDGYTATKLIRSDLGSDIPVVAMTAHAFEGEREKCISCGMNDYLSKPIREKELMQIIERYNVETGSSQTQEGIAGGTEENAAPVKTIDLAYLNEISGGNKKFETEILKQFMLQAPEELQELEKAYGEETWQQLKSKAHMLKTTTSILGLQPLLFKHLETLENLEEEQAKEKRISDSMDEVISICNNAIKEARALLSATA